MGEQIDNPHLAKQNGSVKDASIWQPEEGLDEPGEDVEGLPIRSADNTGWAGKLE